MSDAFPDNSANSSTEDYEDLYENAPCGYLSLAPDGRIVKVNVTLARWLGFPSEELLTKRFHDLLNIAGRIFYETHFAPLLRMQGYFNEVALEMVTKETTRLPVLINATERRDATGKHLFTRVTVFNATDRRRYERELVDAKSRGDKAQKELNDLYAKMQASLRDVQETSALREQFIAVLGHDLRNPLAAINGGIELLRRTPLNEKAVNITGMIQTSVNRMAGLIEDIMDFARGRLGGGITLNSNADEPLEPALRHIVTEAQISAPDRTIESHFDIQGVVVCDRRRIGQLVSNLLANAITHGGTDTPIKISATVSGGNFALFVANGGKPISPEAMEHIFQPFSRGSVRPSMQGLGLGLYIAHSIAVAHGGSLEVKSSQEETRFSFRMPANPNNLAHNELDTQEPRTQP